MSKLKCWCIKEDWKQPGRKDLLLLKRAKASLPLMAPSGRNRVITTPSMMTVSPIGAIPVMNFSPVMSLNATFPKSCTNTKPNLPITDVGCMNLPMGMYGFPL